MNKREIEVEIKKIVSEITSIPVDELMSEASFADDYNLDSLRALEILAAVENKFEIMINPDYLTDMTCIEKVVEITYKTIEDVMGI